MPNVCEPFTCGLLACMCVFYVIPKTYRQCRKYYHRCLIHRRSLLQRKQIFTPTDFEWTSSRENDNASYISVEDSHTEVFEPRPSRPSEPNIIMPMVEVHEPVDDLSQPNLNTELHHVLPRPLNRCQDAANFDQPNISVDADIELHHVLSLFMCEYQNFLNGGHHVDERRYSETDL